MAVMRQGIGERRPIQQVPDGRPPLLIRRLTIRCPETGSPADTGFELTALPMVTGEQTLLDCLECGQDHTWVAEDAYLA